MLIVDVTTKLVGKNKMEYRSILWSSFRAYCIESSGGVLDDNAEMKVFTNLPEMPRIQQDLSKTDNVAGIHSYVSDMV